MNDDPHGAAPEVLGLDNVRLQLPIAGLGNRVLAAFIDHFLVGLVTIVVFFALMMVGAALDGGAWIIGLLTLVMFLLTWGAFAAMEIAMGGQTPGKRALELRVVANNGGTASTGALIVRNLLRVVDLWIGIVLMAVDPRARRLGDRLAGTIVVHERKPVPRLIVGRVPAGWGDAERALVENFVERAPSLEPDRAHAIAHRILAWIRRDDPSLLVGDDPTKDPLVRVRLAFRVESV
jgi:uncharacterized RDD family membrane protein YckC